MTRKLLGRKQQHLGIHSLEIRRGDQERNVLIHLVLHALSGLVEPRRDGSGDDGERLEDAVDVVVVGEAIARYRSDVSVYGFFLFSFGFPFISST